MARVNDKGKLTWEASVAEDVTGYRVYRSVGSPLPSTPDELDISDYVDVGMVLEVAIEALGFDPVESDAVWYGVTAWDTSFNESDVTQIQTVMDQIAPNAPTNLQHIIG